MVGVKAASKQRRGSARRFVDPYPDGSLLDHRSIRAVALPFLLAACAASPQPVPLVGAAGDVHALAGEWVGDYSSAASGRSGSISFTLRAADDSAFGDVVMVPVGMARPLAPWRQEAAAAAPRPSTEVLTIRFVRVESGHVSGTLAPYADPLTGARLVTTFAGELNGHTIEGTYTTRLPSGDTQTGRWTVQRK